MSAEIQNIHSRAAKDLFADDHPEGDAQRHLPQRNGRRNDEGKQQAGDKKPSLTSCLRTMAKSTSQVPPTAKVTMRTGKKYSAP